MIFMATWESHRQLGRHRASFRIVLNGKCSSVKTVTSDMVYLHDRDFAQERADGVDDVLDAQSFSLWQMSED